jgi:hypothetical protein
MSTCPKEVSVSRDRRRLSMPKSNFDLANSPLIAMQIPLRTETRALSDWPHTSLSRKFHATGASYVSPLEVLRQIRGAPAIIQTTRTQPCWARSLALRAFHVGLLTLLYHSKSWKWPVFRISRWISKNMRYEF